MQHTENKSCASRHVVVVGGGISGLAITWHIANKSAGGDIAVTVLEGRDRPGGTAWTEQICGYTLETGPNGFLDNKPHMIALCSAVGLGDCLVRANDSAANRFVFLGDRLRKLPGGPGEFLKSDLLSWRGKLRVLAERFVRPRRDETDESIYDFGCRRIGREATEVLLDAFVTGVLAGDPKRLSLVACFPRMHELEREYGSLLRAQVRLAKERRAARLAQEGKPSAPVGSPVGVLTVPQGGMGTLIRRLADQLGPALHLRHPVSRIERRDDRRWIVRGDDDRRWDADAVVLACPAYSQAEIVNAIDTELAAEIGSIAYVGCVVAVLGFRRADVSADLNGFGYLAPQRLGRSVLGVLWSSSIFPDQAPPDAVQFRAILGGSRRPDVLDWTDEKIIASVQEDLRLTLGIDAPIAFSWLHRWKHAIPQYYVGHLQRLQRIDRLRRRHPGLMLGGNAYRGVALNDCARDAEQIACEVSDYLLRTDQRD